jgi:prolyl-tRNA synthetase
MAGAYTYLPLGYLVLQNIISIIREEMNKIGGQEVLMTTLQEPKHWEASGRWSAEQMDVWFKTELKGGGVLGLAPTHEEPLTNLMKEHISSYRDLPKYIYQFQNKFRNELRAKSGIMRSREFIMKDLYSFSRTEEEFRKFYEACAEAYLKIFARVGLGGKTYRTFASGGSFSKYSDEFQTVSDAGEDTIYVHEGKNIAVNKEVYNDEVLADLGLKKSDLKEVKAIEVGNIFPLGTRFSDALNLRYKDEAGAKQPIIMGSYGIGPGRLLATVVEASHDERGILWPEAVAPYRVHIVEVRSAVQKVKMEADRLYKKLLAKGVDVLYDDRDDKTAGEKFADADLIGIPWRVVVSERSLEKRGVEVKRRGEEKAKIMSADRVLKMLK